MKKLLITFIVLLVILSVHAQNNNTEDKKKKIDPKFSIIGSINFSTINEDNNNYEGLLLGGLLGIGLDLIELNESIKIRTGLQFSMQGAKHKSYDEGEYNIPSSNSRLRMNYLNLPITARYNHSSGFYAEAGIQPALLISAKTKNEGSTQDVKDQFRSLDLGIPFGAGYDFNKIGIGGRITPGILNIRKEENYSLPKEKNFVMSVRMTYTLGY